MIIDCYVVVLIDLMWYCNDVFLGMMEFMFIVLMLVLKECGYLVFLLGMVLLVGLDFNCLCWVWDCFGVLIFCYGGSFYKFEGLCVFKDKFDFDWMLYYLVMLILMLLFLLLVDVVWLIVW